VVLADDAWVNHMPSARRFGVWQDRLDCRGEIILVQFIRIIMRHAADCLEMKLNHATVASL